MKSIQQAFLGYISLEVWTLHEETHIISSKIYAHNRQSLRDIKMPHTSTCQLYVESVIDVLNAVSLKTLIHKHHNQGT